MNYFNKLSSYSVLWTALKPGEKVMQETDPLPPTARGLMGL